MKLKCEIARLAMDQGEEVHHAVFQVFGGRDGDDNYICRPVEVHREFHRLVNKMLKEVGEKTIYWGTENWKAKIKMADDITKEVVEDVVTAAAAIFDAVCDGPWC